MTVRRAAPRVSRMVDCRGGCRTPVPILDAICPLCLAELPDDLRAEFHTAHTGFHLVARWAVEDECTTWLYRHRATVP